MARQIQAIGQLNESWDSLRKSTVVYVFDIAALESV